MTDDESTPSPALYGLDCTNRTGDELWGKNQFNSTFPGALLCYMRDKGIPTLYLKANDEDGTEIVELPVHGLFGTSPGDRPYFSFESAFEPFNRFLFDQSVERADLVVGKANDQGGLDRMVRPLEIKLTVLPDSTTASRPEIKWGSEIVIRPSTTMYCALTLFAALEQRSDELRRIVEPACYNVERWDSEAAVLQALPAVIECLERIQATFGDAQEPLIVQPIWCTEGVKPNLRDFAFDVFVWSNLAFIRLVVDRLGNAGGMRRVSRPARAALRIARLLHELCRGRISIARLLAQMTYGYQSDKECALNGSITSQYLRKPPFTGARIRKEAVTEIILHGGENQLSPERRFDATIFFTAKELFEIQEAVEHERIERSSG